MICRLMMRRLKLVLALAALLTLPALSYAQTYTIGDASPSPTPAGIAGETVNISGSFPATWSAATYGVCFYTGYGASATIIYPTATSLGSATVALPASSIQSILPAQFTSGDYQASLYIVPGGSTCTGTADPVLTSVQTIDIRFPSINVFAPVSIPQKNAATGAQPPPLTVNINGLSLAPNAVVNYTWTGGNGTGTAVLAPDKVSMVAGVPATIPSTVTDVTASVCNHAPLYDYCASPLDIPLSTLVGSTGSMSAAPSPASVGQTVTLSAQFSTVSGPNPGAVSGLVTFNNGVASLGTGRLVLDAATGISSPGPVVNIPALPISGAKVADLNGDGLPDLVYMDNDLGIDVFLSTTPYGNFQPYGQSFSSCTQVDSYDLGDVNGDGLPDIVLHCQNSGNFYLDVMLGNGDGTFGGPPGTELQINNVNGAQIALADMDKDGKLDVVTAGLISPGCSPSLCSKGFQIYKGDGTGDFTLAKTLTTSDQSVSTNPPYPAGQVLLKDVDGDGFLDIVALNNTTQNTNSIDVYGRTSTTYGTLSGSYSVPTTSVPLNAFPDFYYLMVTGDFNGDGFPDFGVLDAASTTQLFTVLNTSKAGTFSFAAPQSVVVSASTVNLSTGDFNGDGNADILVANGNGYNVYVSDGLGGFSSSTYAGLAETTSDSVATAVAADLNGDGNADVMSLTSNGVSSVTLDLNTFITKGPATATLKTSFNAAATGLSLSAVWPGNVNINGSTANTSLTINAIGTSTSLVSSGTPTEYGQTVTFTATVSAGAAGVPSGSVTFNDGATTLGTVNLVSGVAALNISTLGAGPHVVNAVYSGNATFATSTSSNVTQTVNRAQVTVSWTPATSTITYGTALGSGQLNATASSKYVASVAGTFNYSPTAGTVLGAGTQPLSVTFIPSDPNDFIGDNGSANITVNQATPTINWIAPSAITYGTALSATQLNATATGISAATVTGTFVYTPASGTVLNAGTNQTLSVTFTSSDANYSNTTGSTTITVNKATPTVNWTAPAPITYGTALSATQLNATATGISAVAVTGTFAYTPAAGTVLNAGPNQALSVTFTSSDANYANATGNTTISVNKATPTVNWTTPSAITYGTALSGTQLNATATGVGGATVSGTFAYTPASGIVLNSGANQVLSVSFTSSDANYSNAAGGTTITVNKATPTINWTAPSAITYGTALSAAQLNATATGISAVAVTGTFAYTPAAGTVLNAGTNQALSVTFTSSDANYSNTTGSTTITVNKATPTVNWTAPAPITYGTALSAAQLNATATGISAAAVTGTFAYTPAAGTVLNAGANQALSVTFTSGDTNYANATGGTTITVNKATPTVNWTAPAPITYGTALSATQLNATATGVGGAVVTGTFAYTPASGTVLTVGANQTLSVSFTSGNANYNNAAGSTTITVNQARPTITWNTPAPIVAGTALSATQLNATATGIGSAALPGSFVYTPASGTVLSAGTGQALSVTFTPTDTVNYSGVTSGTTIDVISLVLSGITPNTAQIGDAAKTITLTGSGFLANSVVQVNGTAVTTTFVSATSLTAVVPATSFTTVQTLHVTVFDPTQNATSSALNISVTAPNPVVVFTGPGTSQPGTQPTLTFTLTNPYPAPLSGTLTLTFAGSGGADDPAIQFATGGRTLNFTIPANSTQTPTIQLQSGTVAGTITVTVVLNAGGQNVTPAGLQPVNITVPTAVPSLTSEALTRSGTTLTVTVHGFSNTREVTTATFHFAGANGSTIADPDIILPVAPIFAGWFSDPTSQPFGSTFTYTQIFTLSEDVSTVGTVTVTLTNSAGTSSISSAQ